MSEILLNYELNINSVSETSIQWEKSVIENQINIIVCLCEIREENL